MSKKNALSFLRINYLRGPNIWTYRSVLEVWLDLGELEDYPSNLLPGLSERLVTWLPALVEHHCGVGERGGFLQRLLEGTWAGHILEHIVIELLNLAGMPTGFGQTRSTSQVGVYRMVFRARDEQVARTALHAGHQLLMAAINDEPFDVEQAVRSVRDKVDDCYLGPSTASIVAAATDRSIPHIRLNEGNLVQLGYGAQQKRIWTAESENTSAIAAGIARDKDLTKTLLKSCGVPIPEGKVVTSAAQAWAAAQDLGLPVVVKPIDGNHGRGVILDLSSQTDIENAFYLAKEHGSEVLVERFIRGQEHRLLVVGGRLIAAAGGKAAWVVGDGQSTVAQLVELQINTDPRRGDSEDFPLCKIDLQADESILSDLQRQGLAPEAIPAAGQKVLIQRNGNVALDCTDEVHPDVAYIAALAARVVGLDIAGIDLVAEDISRPLHAQGAAVVEVNGGPGLLMHLKPAEGKPRPVGRAIVDHLFPETEHNPGNTGRIPIIGIAGSDNTPLLARLITWLVQLSGRHAGLACQEGFFLGTRQVEHKNCANWLSGQRLLMNREVETAVIENGAHSILQDGLAYDRCSVGIVTDLTPEQMSTLSEFDIQTPEHMFKVLRTQIDVVLPDGVAVLNGSDAHVLPMATLCDGEVMLYAADAQLPSMISQRERGLRCVFIKNQHIIMARGSQETVCLDLGKLRRRAPNPLLAIETMLPAVACAWALGMAPELIKAGIETFAPGIPIKSTPTAFSPVAA